MFDVQHIIAGGGLLLVAAIVFAESGLLIGFFLPGDTLLLSVGVFAAEGKLPLLWSILVIVLANILGNEAGYHIGRSTGPRIFKKADGILFRHEYIERAEKFYEAHGSKTMILARFIPVVRTLASVVAGVGKMNRARFWLYNVIGGVLWGVGITSLGYLFGSRIPNIDHYILPTLIAVSILTFGSPLYHVLSQKDARQKLWQRIKRR